MGAKHQAEVTNRETEIRLLEDKNQQLERQLNEADKCLPLKLGDQTSYLTPASFMISGAEAVSLKARVSYLEAEGSRLLLRDYRPMGWDYHPDVRLAQIDAALGRGEVVLPEGDPDAEPSPLWWTRCWLFVRSEGTRQYIAMASQTPMARLDHLLAMSEVRTSVRYPRVRLPAGDSAASPAPVALWTGSGSIGWPRNTYALIMLWVCAPLGPEGRADISEVQVREGLAYVGGQVWERRDGPPLAEFLAVALVCKDYLYVFSASFPPDGRLADHALTAQRWVTGVRLLPTP